MKKYIFPVLMVVGIFSGLAAGYFSAKAEAVVAVPYGGRVLFASPYFCNCSGGTWIMYLPTQPTLLTGLPVLIYSPYTTILYSNYNIMTPGVQHLGQFIPGAGVCTFYIVYGCAYVANSGVIFQVGTSLTPGPS